MRPEDIPTRNNPEEYIKYKQGLMQHLIDIYKRKEDKEKNEHERFIYHGIVELLEIYKSV